MWLGTEYQYHVLTGFVWLRIRTEQVILFKYLWLMTGRNYPFLTEGVIQNIFPVLTGVSHLSVEYRACRHAMFAACTSYMWLGTGCKTVFSQYMCDSIHLGVLCVHKDMWIGTTYSWSHWRHTNGCKFGCVPRAGGDVMLILFNFSSYVLRRRWLGFVGFTITFH